MLIVVLVIIGLLILIPCIIRVSKHNLDFTHLGEESYQKFAKFFGLCVPKDEDYEKKMNIIYDQVFYKKNESISDIAKKASCPISDCIMKINYLKNKKILGDYSIEQNRIYLCDAKDEMMLNKYKPYIYQSHLQVDEIVSILGESADKIFDELQYLDHKKLLNGLILQNHKIIYYSIEKKKLHGNIVIVHCPKCGAFNDVDIHGKTKCGYCDEVLVGEDYIG